MLVKCRSTPCMFGFDAITCLVTPQRRPFVHDWRLSALYATSYKESMLGSAAPHTRPGLWLDLGY